MDTILDFFTSPFDQPVGATADLKELEYISALLQTGKVLRSDGSLTAEDVAHYLLSRHGIRVSPECVNNTIFQVFGVDEEAEGEVLDLVELTAILVIPIMLIMRKSIMSSKKRSSSKLSTSAIRRDEKDARTTERPRRLLKDPKGVLRSVLSMIFQDSSTPINAEEEEEEDTAPRLTEELIQEILRSYGMHYLADDDTHVSQMLIAAQGQTSGDNAKLDEVAFIQALTSDVVLFKNEILELDGMLLSTSLLSPKQICKDRIESDNKEDEDELNSILDQEEGKLDTSNMMWQKVFTANPIDFTTDSYTSVVFVVCLWVCFLLFFYAYVDANAKTSVCNSESAGCRIANSVVSWLGIAATLMLSGVLFIGVGSAGFIPSSKPILCSALGTLGMATVAIFTIFSFFYPVVWLRFDTVQYQDDPTMNIARYLTLCLGCFLIFQQILYFIPSKGLILRRFIESSYFAEKNIHQAAVFKLARMVQNAQELHSTWENEKEMGGTNTCFGRALLQFSKQSQSSEKFSLIRAWSHVLNGKFFKEEGLWLSSRLLSGIFIQLFAVCFLCIYAKQSVNDFISIDQPTYNCTLHDQSYYLSGCPFDTVGACYANCTNTPGALWLEKAGCRLTCNTICDPCQPTSFFPLWSYKFSLLASLSITGVSLCIQALNYIPSYIKTTLKFRTGVHTSLGDPYFEDYRIQAALGGNLTGAMFFGVLISGLAIALLLCLTILFFTAPVFRDAVVTILIIVAGFVINVAIKVSLTMIFRLKCFASFYRRHPAIANIAGLMFECWNIALASGFVLLRAVKLIFTSAFYIGRVDIPMLHIHGRLRPWSVDLYPMIFRADILAHEAHRHPYIETIGLVYLNKLKNQDFANAAGSTWRVLFVMSLFPWVRKYSFRRKYTEPDRAKDPVDDNVDLKTSIASLKQKAEKSLRGN